MKNLRKQTRFIFFLLFFSIHNFLSAQSFLNLNNDNLDEVIGYIELNYGDQMLISLDEVTSFLIAILEQNEIGENCEPPNPEFFEISPQTISFQWEEIPSAEEYGIDYINLYNGTTEAFNTSDNSADLPAAEDLFLFAFQTDCSLGFTSNTEFTSSTVNIIIVDKDIMFNGPPEVQDCDCYNPVTFFLPITLYSSSSTLPTARMPWQYTCNNSKYKVSVESYSGPSYFSEFAVVHNHVSAPDLIYFLPMCFNQFTASTSSPVFFGDSGQYFVSLDANDFTLHFNNTYLAANSTVRVDACKCRSRKIKPQEDNAINSTSSNQSKVFPNPFNDNFSIEYSLDNAETVKIELFNSFGQLLNFEEINHSTKGSYEFEFKDIQKLSAGMYKIILHKNNSSEILKVIKTKG